MNRYLIVIFVFIIFSIGFVAGSFFKGYIDHKTQIKREQIMTPINNIKGKDGFKKQIIFLLLMLIILNYIIINFNYYWRFLLNLIILVFVFYLLHLNYLFIIILSPLFSLIFSNWGRTRRIGTFFYSNYESGLGGSYGEFGSFGGTNYFERR